VSGGIVDVESVSAALDRVYATLIAGNTEVVGRALASRTRLDRPCGAQQLEILFGLSAFERDVVLLCAGAELQTRFQPAFAAVHGDPRTTWPTFGLTMSALGGSDWSALSRLRPLRYWRLVEFGAGPLVNAPLQIDERILQFVLGVETVDERVDPVIRAIPVDRMLQPPRLTVLTRSLQNAQRRWERQPNASDPILLMGGRASTRLAAFLQLCRACDCRPFVLSAADLPAVPSDRETLARFWTREAILTRAALYVHMEQTAGDQGAGFRNLTSWLHLVGARVAVDVHVGSPAEHLSGLRVEVSGLSVDERKTLWRRQLGPLARQMNGEIDRLAEYFHFDESAIALSAGAALESTASADQGLAKVAWRTCRQYARRSLEGLAQRIEPAGSWPDLVLPPAQTESLRQIGIHLRQRAVVNDEWGFSNRHSRGLGLSALFAGASGTGKTLAAEILAGELELDLYQIDLATIVSKYIGETEKNLRKIFEAAEESGAILFFDEADALFGKRSEVRDSHDRYANLEVSYLLQRMDTYRGVAILTSNLQHSLDTAFLRRIRFIVQFPFPDAASRARIWERIFPKETPIGAVDFTRLAQLNVSGGVIRNIAMHAAFLAAEQRTNVDMGQLLVAARIEYAKLDKPLTAAETRGWI
jgi:hypothetical protein